MVTLETFTPPRQSEYYVASPYSRRIVRVRVTGQLRQWKRTGEWRIPIKFGLYESSAIGTHSSCGIDPSRVFTSAREAIEVFPRYAVQAGLV